MSYTNFGKKTGPWKVIGNLEDSTGQDM